MKNPFCTIFFLAIFSLALMIPISSANAITVNYGQSSWNTESVTIRFENVPTGKRVTVCVYKDDGCDIRKSIASPKAGQDHVVLVIVPKGDGSFASGDKVRATCETEYVCSQLSTGTSLIAGNCETTCETCAQHTTGAPSLTQWGMIALVFLMLAAGVLIIRRRRLPVQA